MPTKIPRSSMIEDVERVAKELGRSPTTIEYDRLGTFSSITVRKEIGAWKNVLLTCNLPRSKNHKNRWTDQDIQDEMDRLTTILGHTPSWTEIKNNSKFSVDTITRRVDLPNKSKELPNDQWDVSQVSPSDGYWIAGFTNGDGSFSVQRTGGCTFTLSQRADDAGILEFSAMVMGLPNSVYYHKNSKRRAMGQKVGDEAHLSVSSRYLLVTHIVPFFDRFSLRGRKQLDYQIFRETLLFFRDRDAKGLNHCRLSEQEKEFVRSQYEKIRALRFDPSKTILNS